MPPPPPHLWGFISLIRVVTREESRRRKGASGERQYVIHPFVHPHVYSCIHKFFCKLFHSATKASVTHSTTLPSTHQYINPLKPELNPICYLLALLRAHNFLHVSRIRVKLLTFRRLMSYTYGAPILNVSRSHTTTQHSR